MKKLFGSLSTIALLITGSLWNDWSRDLISGWWVVGGLIVSGIFAGCYEIRFEQEIRPSL